jgi:hypothetical protein
MANHVSRTQAGASQQSEVECQIKTFEIQLYKSKAKVYSDRTETGKYKELHEEQSTDAYTCQHILNKTKECLEREDGKFLSRTEHNRPILNTVRTRPVMEHLSHENIHCNLELNSSFIPRGSLIAPSSKPWIFVKSLEHYLSRHLIQQHTASISPVDVLEPSHLI